MKKITILLTRLLLVSFLFTMISCEKETEGVSSVAYYPVLKMKGSQYINVKRADGAKYVDPGIKAFFETKEIPFQTTGSIDMSKLDFNTLTYSVEPMGKYPRGVSKTRYVLVSEEIISTNPFGGSYSLVGGTIGMTVTEVALGVYSSTNIGVSSKAIPAKFVWFGGNSGLKLLPSTAFTEGTVTWDRGVNTLTFQYKLPNDATFTVVTYKKN